MSNKQKDQITTPSGSGGLVNFREEYPSKLRITPEWVFIIIAIVVIGITALKLML
jgi:preprotein translocase subunit Sec61beta